MVDSVKGPASSARPYHSPRRAAQAARTRLAILEAARTLFVTKGYPLTTVTEIATLAQVSVDTLYASIGRKPDLLRVLVETSISGVDRAVPADERDYVQQISRQPAARDKLAVYASALAAIHQRMAPVFLALRDAAVADPECAALWREIAERRAANMLCFAEDLRTTGELRADLTDRQVADVIWSMNAPEYWVLLVHERSWTPEAFTDWVADAWARALLG